MPFASPASPVASSRSNCKTNRCILRQDPSLPIPTTQCPCFQSAHEACHLQSTSSSSSCPQIPFLFFPLALLCTTRLSNTRGCLQLCCYSYVVGQHRLLVLGPPSVPQEPTHFSVSLVTFLAKQQRPNSSVSVEVNPFSPCSPSAADPAPWQQHQISSLATHTEPDRPTRWAEKSGPMQKRNTSGVPPCPSHPSVSASTAANLKCPGPNLLPECNPPWVARHAGSTQKP